MQPVYLDNNATTRMDAGVLAAMLPYFTEHFGNPSSQHGFGTPAGEAVRAAREQVRALIGAEHAHEIVFTSGGTESDNAAILSALECQAGRNEIIVSAVEHPAVLALVQHLAKHRGAVVRTIPVDGKGRLDTHAYRAALGANTAIASIMWANNETGTIFPVAELAALAHEAGALFHTDAVQAMGRVHVDVKSTVIDMLSLSAHKLHGPKGIGALYVRKGVRFHPLIRGGKQERGRRAGTENVPGIVGLGKAAELVLAYPSGQALRVGALRDLLEAGVLTRIGGCFVAGDTANRLPNTSNIVFDGALGEVDPHGAEQGRHRGLFGLCLRLGLGRAFPRAARHESAVHRGTRRHPLLFQPREHASRSRARAGSFARGRREGPRGFRLRARHPGACELTL